MKTPLSASPLALHVALLLLCMPRPLQAHNIAGPPAMVDKVTFRVDTRNITVAPTGMFIAGSFFSTIGYPNWTFLPMCDLGSGIWEISFVNIPPGMYQYKFVNGNAPPGWEFNGSGGPCTNPLDNNNRFVNVTGGVQLEGPHCYNTCNMFCAGFGDPGVSDTEPPSITGTVPSNTTVSCGSPLPAALPLAADDGCDANATTTTGPPVDNLSGLGACGTGNITRTWSVTDCAGNMTTATQTITLNDNTAPTITGPVPPNVTVQCGNLPPAMPLAASDACDASLVSTGLPSDNTSGIGPCGTGTIVRTWTATDCSGNTVSASQNITLTDNTPPTITANVPADITVACGAIPAPAALQASDNCDPGVTATGLPTDNTAGIGPCGTGTIVRTWSVSDCSGNMTSASQTITVVDNTPPVFANVPPNIFVDCNDPFPPTLPLNASDDCDISVSVSPPPTDDFSNVNACGVGIVTRTWQVDDCAGNLATATQTITLVDAVAPFFLDPVPADVTVSCGNLPPAAPLAAADGCDLSVFFSNFPADDLSGIGNCGAGTVVRTWMVSDCSGNTFSASQNITVLDDSPPMITGAVPADLTIGCGSLPPAAPLAAVDNCDPAVLSTGLPTDNTSGLNACGTGTVIRTWTAMDCAGNATLVSQAITLTDNDPPSLTIPVNTTYQCGNIPPASAADASASDDCSTPTIVFLGETTVGTGCPYELHRTWSATDCVGNSTTLTQIIAVGDTTAPVFTNPPPNLAVCVGDVPPMTDLAWTDNCDGSGQVAGTESSDGMTNPETITRTWNYTDACGNSVSYAQTITVSSSGASNAGPDQTVCGSASVSLSATGAGSASTVQWTTSGDGVFDNENAAATFYAPGPGDLANGSATLTFTPIITGGNCTIAPDEVVISFLAEPLANAGSAPTINCASPIVQLNGSGSSAGTGITYQWSGPGINAINENEQNPTVDQPGLYTLNVTENNQCTSADTVMVFENTNLPVANAGADMVLTCAQTVVQLDGSNSSAGPGYAYQWAGPGITAGNAGLQNPTVSEAGVYTLTVTDLANGCSAMDQTGVMLDGNLPIADAGPDLTINCNQFNTLDGSNSSSGPGIDYQWFAPDGSPLGTGVQQPATASGTYTLTVSDTNNGCSISSTVEVSYDTLPPVADAGPDQTLGCGAATVTLGGNSSVGAGIHYAWGHNGLAAGDQITLTVSEPGIYFFSVSNDTNVCVAFDTVVVFQNTNTPIASAGADQTLDCATPVANLDGSGSSMGVDIVYEWSGPGFSSFEISPSVVGPGVYILTVTDTATACSATDTVLVASDAGLPLADAGGDTSLTCAVDEILLGGGNSSQGPDIAYEWTDAAGNVLGNALNLLVNQAGTYTLSVTNISNNCVVDDEILVLLDTISPLANAGPDTEFTCNQTTLTLDGSASSAGNGIVYLWTGPGITTNPAQVQVAVNEIGSYTLTVTNLANGCTAADQVAVSQNPDVPEADAGPDQTLTCDNPSVQLQGSANPLPATFQWSGPGIQAGNANLPSPTVTVPGVYTLVVTDPLTGCQSPASTVMVLDGQVPPAVSIAASGALDCQTASVLLVGNTDAQGSAVAYQWLFENNPIPNATDSTWQAVIAGTYILIATNLSNGCSQSDTAAVSDQVVLPPVNIAGPMVLNCYEPAIGLSETAAASLPDVAYQWATLGGHFTQTQLDGPEVALDSPGIYMVWVTDLTNGCSAADTVQVTADFEQPSIVLAPSFELGCGSTGAVLDAGVSASVNSFAYAWSGNGFSSNEASPTVTSPGQYDLVVTLLTSGCTAAAFTAVQTAQAITGVEILATQPTCPGAADGSLEVVVLDGAHPPYLYSLDGGLFTETALFDGLASGSYQLAVQDGAGCEWEGDATLEAPAGVFVELGDDVLIKLGDSIRFDPVYPNTVSSFEWTHAVSLSCADCPTPFAYPLETTEYTLLVKDANGCAASDNITVAIDPRLNIYVPTAFSPNGDGINDYFTIFSGRQVQLIQQLQVFDRWGGQLFKVENIPPGATTAGWDGTHKGKAMPQGVYVFWAEVRLVTGETERLKGEVLLMR